MLMLSVENSASPSSEENLGRSSVVIGLSFILSAVLGASALVVTSGDGAQAARELVVRFSLLVFVGFLLAEPLAVLYPGKVLLALARMRGSLRLAFVVASVFSLVCILLPVTITGAALPASALLYISLNALVLSAMLFATSRTAMRIVGAPGWRAIQLIAVAYFWLTFLVTALVRLIAIGGTTVWYPFVLALLVATLGAVVAARVHGSRAEPTVRAGPAPIKI